MTSVYRHYFNTNKRKQNEHKPDLSFPLERPLATL